MSIVMKRIMRRIILIITTILIPISCSAIEIKHVRYLSELKSLADNTQITVPYYLLSQTKYTDDLHTFTYLGHRLKILNKDNPNKILLQVTNIRLSTEYKSDSNTELQLPWWSKSAPDILHSLDFSKVDGRKSVYQINYQYRLTLLSRQGNWGKVYVLEHVLNDIVVQKVCAVKVLLTRPEYGFSTEDFRARHKQEMLNNIAIAELNLPLAIELFGIIKNDEDHYLLLSQYGNNAYEILKNQPLDTSIDQLIALQSTISKMHNLGYAHGDLTIHNLLFVNKEIKLCDWFSVEKFANIQVGTYRYVGSNLPPEAIRAFYFKGDNKLKYSQVFYNNIHHTYILHPIVADRFCIAISMLEILAEDLHQEFENRFPKGFDPYAPNSLMFWQNYADFIVNLQNELKSRATKATNLKQRELLMLITKYISLDPLDRSLYTN